MKKLLIAVFVCLLFQAASAQEGASNWGSRILFGTQFTSTDSSRLRTASLSDTVAADTLYSGILEIGDHTTGILAVKMYLTNVLGGSDSLKLDIRLVDQVIDTNTRQTYIKFGPWVNVFNLAGAGAVNDTLIDASTSSWWMPATGRQYRLYDTSVSTDKTTHIVTDYVR